MKKLTLAGHLESLVFSYLKEEKNKKSPSEENILETVSELEKHFEQFLKSEEPTIVEK
jgi:hypothetical protein